MSARLAPLVDRTADALARHGSPRALAVSRTVDRLYAEAAGTTVDEILAELLDAGNRTVVGLHA